MPLRRATDRLKTMSKPTRRIGLGTVLGCLFFLSSSVYFNLQNANRLRALDDATGGRRTIFAPGGTGDMAAYTTEELVAAMERYGGTSKKVRAIIGLPGTTAGRGNERVPLAADITAGIWPLALATNAAVHQIAGLRLIALLPFSAKQNGRVGPYHLGAWPAERGRTGPGKAPDGKYDLPEGFIKVNQGDVRTPLSEHFKIGDFLTHDQATVWPKYLVLRPELLDKLELVLSDLQAQGINTSGTEVLSGFRNPEYNAKGGRKTGKADLSRHMFGDAADIYIDSDEDGIMDDLNGDGESNIMDAGVILAAANRVEMAHPELVGGVGIYPATKGHGGFAHIDVRGYRARWVGVSEGVRRARRAVARWSNKSRRAASSKTGVRVSQSAKPHTAKAKGVKAKGAQTKAKAGAKAKSIKAKGAKTKAKAGAKKRSK